VERRLAGVVRRDRGVTKRRKLLGAHDLPSTARSMTVRLGSFFNPELL
jgi:hypothetical protein